MYTGMTVPPVNVPIRRTAHCVHVISANETEACFNLPRRRRGSNLGPLAPEASALPFRHVNLDKPSQNHGDKITFAN